MYISEKLNFSLGICLLPISQPLLGLLIADVGLLLKEEGEEKEKSKLDSAWTKTRALKRS